MSSTLTTMNQRFQSKLTTYEALAKLPAPPSLGPIHKPVHHALLVDAIRREMEARGWTVAREQYALSKNAQKLFGVIDLQPNVPMISAVGERGLSFGFRNSTDRSLAIRGVAGERVFVCDNLSMSGTTFAMDRRNTTNLDLRDAVAAGFDKFLVQIAALDLELVKLQETPITDDEAKLIAFDAFAEGILPVRLFDDVERHYFRPEPGMTDCEPRSLWGLHNAFTRALQSLAPARMFSASVAVSRHFGIRS